MKDVALKVKVSTATVFRALMRIPIVSRYRNQQQFEKAAWEVGYLPAAYGAQRQSVMIPHHSGDCQDIYDPSLAKLLAVSKFVVRISGAGWRLCASKSAGKSLYPLIITKTTMMASVVAGFEHCRLIPTLRANVILPPMWWRGRQFAPGWSYLQVHIDDQAASRI